MGSKKLLQGGTGNWGALRHHCGGGRVFTLLLHVIHLAAGVVARISCHYMFQDCCNGLVLLGSSLSSSEQAWQRVAPAGSCLKHCLCT